MTIMKPGKLVPALLMFLVLLPASGFCITYNWASIAGDYADAVTPFNLVLTGDMVLRNSDVEGRVAVKGNADLRSFSIGLKASPGANTMIAGGDIKAGGAGDSDGGQFENGGVQAGGSIDMQRVGLPTGNIVAGGDVKLSSLSVNNGSVRTGGSLDVEHAYIEGDAVAGGNITLEETTVKGTARSSGTVSLTSAYAGGTEEYDPDAPGNLNLFDFSAIDLDAISDALWRDTFKAPEVDNGKLVFEASAGTNFFSLDADTLDSAWGIEIDAPSDAAVVINVSGSNAILEDMAFNLQGGISSNGIIYNFYQADRLVMHNLGLQGSVIAPSAYVTFYSGVMEGMLMARSLGLDGAVPEPDGIIRSGQINQVPVPEPSTFMLMFLGLASLLIFISSGRKTWWNSRSASRRD